MALLGPQQIEEAVRGLSGWEYKNKAIVKTFRFTRFMQAVDFVNQVAAIAEGNDHHPDMTINYTRVTFVCSTHSEGGVTEKDLRLAHEIESAYHLAGQGGAD